MRRTEAPPDAPAGQSLSVMGSDLPASDVGARAELATGWRVIVRGLARDRTARIGIVIVLVFVLAAVFAPWIATRDPNEVDVLRKLQPPSRKFLLGTDHLGRDVWARMVYGARLSIGTSVLAALGVSAVGVLLGMLAGFLGGIVDSIVSRVVEVLLSIPGFLLALAVTGVLGPGLRNLLMVMVAVSWAGYARIVRGLVIAERQMPYVEAAQAAGTPNWRIALRHLLPNMSAPVIVLTTLDMGAILLSLAGLSFLGLGVQPPTAEWGAMLSEAKAYLGPAPNMMLFPGAAIFLMVLGFNLFGDGLRDVLDPRTRIQRRAPRPARDQRAPGTTATTETEEGA